MEVAAADYFIVVREHDWVVSNRIDFSGNCIINIVDGVSGCTVNLRQASLGIWILHLGRMERKCILGAFQQSSHVFCHIHLTLVTAEFVGLRVVSLGDGVERFAGQCTCDVGNLCQVHGIVQGVQANCSQHLGTVVQCQAFLGSQFNRSQASRRESVLRFDDFALVFHHAHADEAQCDAGQRCQVAGCANGTLFRNDRMNACVQHIDQGLQGFQADAGIASCQRVGSQQHGCSHIFLLIRLAHCTGVRHNQVLLQLCSLLCGNGYVGKLAETGGQAVYNCLVFYLLFYISSGFLHRFHCFSGQFHLFAVTANSDDLFYCQVASVD